MESLGLPMTSDAESQQWPDPGQLDSMASMQDIDFSSFLDIGDIDLSHFSPLDQDHGHGHLSGHHDSHEHASANAHAQSHNKSSSSSSTGGNDAGNGNINGNGTGTGTGTGHGPLIPGNQVSGDGEFMSGDQTSGTFDMEQYDMPMGMDQEHAMHLDSDLDGSGGHHGMNQDWMQLQMQMQMQQNAYHPPQHVPPTPNSYEMHGDSAPRYLLQQMDPQARAALEQQHYQHKHQTDGPMSFTPLVSPAVTPQDSHFHSVPEYAMIPGGAYFSPLTSPAIQAQKAGHQSHGYYTAGCSTASSTVVTSPIDLNADVQMSNDAHTPLEQARKSRRKPQAPRATGAARVRQSPIVKAQKRKSTTLSSVIPPQELEMAMRRTQTQPKSTGHVLEGSGSDSISPEPMLDALMGPPPKPGSAVPSPALRPHVQSAPPSTILNGSTGAPATPASLMAIGKSLGQRPGGSQRLMPAPSSLPTLPKSLDEAHIMDDFSLPPSVATSLPQAFKQAGTSAPPSADSTPRLSASRKTPKLGPSHTPASVLSTHSATSSPMFAAMGSPNPTATPSSSRRLESKPNKPPRKRSSISAAPSSSSSTTTTALVSPAIRPKISISPSIKPLLPGSDQHQQQQQALLLASKSNYTHLLEGTLLPGVSYPESLSSGLTSKRTSHKIAEQGRRNRINEALKEMQALLPPKASTSASSRSGSGSANASTAGARGLKPGSGVAPDEEAVEDEDKATADSKNASSKAATVESAIEYIKALQRERAQAVLALEVRDREMGELRRQLRDAKLRGGGIEGGNGGDVGAMAAVSASVGNGDDDMNVDDVDDDDNNGEGKSRANDASGALLATATAMATEPA